MTTETRDTDFKTPYDHPHGLLQRVTFPFLIKGYRKGVLDTIEAVKKMAEKESQHDHRAKV